MRRTLPAALLALLLSAPLAAAHDLWLVPPETAAAGQPVQLLASVGMDFPNSENAHDTAQYPKRLLVRPDGSAGTLEAAGKKDKYGLLKFQAEKPGIYIAAVQTQPRLIKLGAEAFNAYLVEDGMWHVFQQRVKDRTLDKPAVERYSKSPKVLLQVGKGGDGDPCRVVGLPLEIVPLKSPFGLKKGDALLVRVLFQGKPLAEANVGWQAPGDGTARGYVRTDAAGEALVPVPRTGLVTLRLTHMTRPNLPEYEWESFWTTLTFRLPD
jgi:uncharacterized GH25 family protein